MGSRTSVVCIASRAAFAAGLVAACAPAVDPHSTQNSAVELRVSELSTTAATDILPANYCYFVHAFSSTDQRLRASWWHEPTGTSPECRLAPPTVGALSPLVDPSIGR